ncbi:MAG: GTP-binding protein [Candidatus Lokiarchaeota archaeon]|nr:GTP-binding protein [Candidatus Lokiarchaeota archaeon]
MADYILKIVILGDAGVGKTSLVNQFVSNTFKADYRGTMGVQIIKKQVVVNDEYTVRLLLWDIAGQDQYEKARNGYYEGASGALLVYDLTRYRSFDNINNKWLKDFRKYVKIDIPYILIGNKADLEQDRAVLMDDAKRLAAEINAIQLIETSARSGMNVEDAFKKLVRNILIKHGVVF